MRSVRMLLPKRCRRRPATMFPRNPAGGGRGLPGRGVLSAPGSSPGCPPRGRAWPGALLEPALALGYLDGFGTVARAEFLDRGGQVVADRPRGQVQRGR